MDDGSGGADNGAKSLRGCAEDGAGDADSDGADVLWPRRRSLLHSRYPEINVADDVGVSTE